MTTQQLDADARDLAQLGYRQRLDRSLHAFSSFALPFSYISVLTGTFALFYLGYNTAGPAFWWSWPLVCLGQFMVAFVFAELATHYPAAGSVFLWTKRVAHPHVGWLGGWAAGRFPSRRSRFRGRWWCRDVPCN